MIRRPSIIPITLGDHEAWELCLGRASAVIASRGATLISWDPAIGESLIAGYGSDEELADLQGSRSALMVPWPGRIAHGQFTFGGRTHEFPVKSDGHARHGLVRDLDFTRTNDSDASLTLEATIPVTEQWPYEVTVSVTYALGVTSDADALLTMTLGATNTGSTEAPVALGWHPLLRLPGMTTIDDVRLTIPARTRVLTNSTLIPLRGESAYAGVSSPVIYDGLGGEEIDTSYVNLVPNADGVVVTSMSSLTNTHRLDLTQEPAEAPVMHVWTGDGLDRGPREALALEPCTHLPDAANRADQAGSLSLEPGQTRSMTTTLSLTS